MDKIETEPLKVYWQPGCSSCLRTKEFLTKHGVSFVSVNVRADETGFNELAALGLRQVPIVARGKDWVNGQVLKDVARIAGINLGEQKQLSPAELKVRIDTILSASQRFLGQIPEEELDTLLPNRPQTYRQLACHVFQIVEAFLDLVENGKRLEFAAYMQDIPDHITTRGELLDFGASVQRRFDAWWDRRGGDADFSKQADVYYGEQTLHEFLERTGWHSGQHTRQLQMIVENLGITPDRPLTSADLEGLPLPSSVWDDQLAFNHA